MGLFRDKGTCSICGETTGKEISDGFLCKDCQNKAGNFLSSKQLNQRDWTISMVQECIKKNNTFLINQGKRKEAFNATRKIGGMLFIDEKNQLFEIKGTKETFRFDQILDYELLEDGESVVKGGLGRAAAGGLLFGGVGAIVGGVTGGKKSNGVCTSLRIRIALDKYYNENVYLNLITTDTKTKGILYKSAKSHANDMLAFLDKVTQSQEVSSTQLQTENQKDPYEELKKVKELLDMGIISQEEFDTKKKQLLGL